MDNLDQLISKFKEAKEELAKSAPLHDTWEGFKAGLLALPKGSARSQFAAAHANHKPFMDNMHAHPEGKKHVGALFGHLDSKANAGFKAGETKVNVQGPTSVMKSIHEEYLDELEKYISPFTLFGGSKKVKPAEAPKSTKLTGSDKIKAVSKEPIQATSVKHDPSKVKGAPRPFTPSSKLTGIDKIKAASQEKIQPTSIVVEDQKRAKAMGAPTNPNVKKDEDEDDEDKKDLKKGMTSDMKGGGGSLNHPKNMDRANAFQAALAGEFQPKAPAGPMIPKAAPGQKLTGMDRIKAAAQQPITPFSTVRKSDLLKQKHTDAPFGKTINSSYDAGTNQSDMAMSRDEKLSLNKGGQWNLKKDKPVAKDEDEGC